MYSCSSQQGYAFKNIKFVLWAVQAQMIKLFLVLADKTAVNSPTHLSVLLHGIPHLRFNTQEIIADNLTFLPPT